MGDLWCQIIHRLRGAWGEDAWGVGDHVRCWACGRTWRRL
jgi:hypothetical protein